MRRFHPIDRHMACRCSAMQSKGQLTFDLIRGESPGDGVSNPVDLLQPEMLNLKGLVQPGVVHG